MGINLKRNFYCGLEKHSWVPITMEGAQQQQHQQPTSTHHDPFPKPPSIPPLLEPPSSSLCSSSSHDLCNKNTKSNTLILSYMREMTSKEFSTSWSSQFVFGKALNLFPKLFPKIAPPHSLVNNQ
jgi:hypothetical protein